METMSEKELKALDDVTDSAVGRRRVLMTRAVGEAWERVGSKSLLSTSCNDRDTS